MENPEVGGLTAYLGSFKQQSGLGAPGSLEQFRLLREVRRELPDHYDQFCNEFGITPKQAEQSYDIAYKLSILARYQDYERLIALFICACLDDERFDDVWFKLQEWDKNPNADMIRKTLVAEMLGQQLENYGEVSKRMQ